MDKNENDDNLEAFHEHQDEVPKKRARRSSILKGIDSNMFHEERRASRRISFHNNIMCQQILPDGTTQIVTEALRIKMRDDSKDDESKMEETNVSITNQIRDNSSDEEEESIAEVSMACDADDERDVLSQESNEKTKMFAADESEGLMDITMMNEDLSVFSDDSQSSQRDETIAFEKTNIFDASKTEAVMNVDSKIDDNDESAGTSGSQAVCSQEDKMASQPMELTQVLGGNTGRVSIECLYNAVSRVSWPRKGLDAAIMMRREQLNKTLTSLKNEDMDLSSSIDSYSSPASLPQSSGRKRFSLTRSRLSIEMRESPMFCMTIQSPFNDTSKSQSSMRHSSLILSNASTPCRSAVENSERMTSDRKNMSTAVNRSQPESSKVTPIFSDFLASVVPSQTTTQASPPKKSVSGSTHLFNTTGDISDESDTSLGVTLEHFDKSYRIPDSEDEDDDDRLHEDSMFEVMQDPEASFALSPNTSLYSSFVNCDDTLMILAEDLEEKLNDCSVFNESNVNSHTTNPTQPFDSTFIPLKRFDEKACGAKIVRMEPELLSVVFLFGTITLNVELGTTLRSFNGVPIKVIKKVGVESKLKADDLLSDIIDADLAWNFPLSLNDDHKVFLRVSHDGFMASFDDVKNQLISKFSTTDKLSDLLTDIGIIGKRYDELLRDLVIAHTYYPCRLYSKTNDNAYEFAFELPGHYRNFFLLLPIDPKSYPFSSIRCRFGFDYQDKPLYNVNTFANALKIAVKPGKTYVNRMIQGAKEYIAISRRIRSRLNK